MERQVETIMDHTVWSIHVIGQTTIHQNIVLIPMKRRPWISLSSTVSGIDVGIDRQSTRQINVTKSDSPKPEVSNRGMSSIELFLDFSYHLSIFILAINQNFQTLSSSNRAVASVIINNL